MLDALILFSETLGYDLSDVVSSFLDVLECDTAVLLLVVEMHILVVWRVGSIDRS